MRATVSLIALLAATPAWADDVHAQAPVARATIYPDGATLTLRADVELPAGTHRVMVPYPGAKGIDSLPRISVSEGVEIGTLGFRRAVAADPESLYSDAQKEALAVIEDIEAQGRAKSDEIAIARADVTALETRADYLASVAPPEDGTPEDILAVADLVSAQTADTFRRIAAARAALVPLEDERDALTQALNAAKADLARLSPPKAENDMLIIEVSHDEAGPVALEFTEQTWAAGWHVDYDMNLDRDAGEIDVDRKIVVTQDTTRTWTDAALTLSTARPNDAIGPTPVYPDKAGLMQPILPRDAAPRGAPQMEAMAEPAIVEDSAMRRATMETDGLSLSYVYPDAVTIAPGEATELALDTLTLTADPQIEAAPRYDDTAFLMAAFTNDTGEPILPGSASLSRDGHFVGQSRIGMIPAGAEETLPFGPIEGIRLDTIFKRNAEGDTGILSKSSTRRQEITLSVENLTEETQDVRTLYPLTFSELEDLDVTVTATPTPNETDVDDKRGVSAWNLTLAPGETRDIEIVVDLDWPEGKMLDWRP